MQNAPKQSNQTWARLNASNKKADAAVLVSLHNSLPRSVRPLLGLSEESASGGKKRTVLDMWDDAIAAQPPGSRRRAFMEAGKAASQQRMIRSKRERVH